ncbi:hypothetical protein VCR31J2_1380047 [Vibrio coralliirubri]|uniref:Uncharacterized protein n=1 Tax=Vibrio coralliirubri TaxID=1516159 RepID=A0AA86WQJ9_9VIBR|nr:hypothetical protein VCR31J2_1380047 [Vibrio coralliirubri]
MLIDSTLLLQPIDKALINEFLEYYEWDWAYLSEKSSRTSASI